MALTASNMLALHTPAPPFALRDTVSGKDETFESLRGKQGTLVVFLCNHCPYVIHLLDSLIEKAAYWKTKGIATIGISSNSIATHPQDGPSYMKTLAEEKEFGFPYLYDPSQAVAHAYLAACTPDFYLFDAAKKLYYRGCFDRSRPGNDIPVSGKEMDAAIERMLNNQTPHPEQYPSMGCNIKWIAGNEPEWWNA